MTAAPDGLVIEGVLTANGFVQTNGASFADWLAQHDAEVQAATLRSAANNEEMGAAYLNPAQSLALRQRAERICGSSRPEDAT